MPMAGRDLTVDVKRFSRPNFPGFINIGHRYPELIMSPEIEISFAPVLLLRPIAIHNGRSPSDLFCDPASMSGMVLAVLRSGSKNKR